MSAFGNGSNSNGQFWFGGNTFPGSLIVGPNVYPYAGTFTPSSAGATIADNTVPPPP